MSVLIKLRDYRNLPEAEKQIRDFILKDPKRIVDMTIYEVAKETFTSTATVVRLCKRVGAKGFNQFKIMIASELQGFENVHLNVLDTTTVSRDDSPKTVIDKITNIDVHSIEETRIILNEDSLVEAANRIHKAQVVDFYGIGASNVVALDATYKFMRIGKNVACYQLNDRQWVQALNSSSKHVAMVFSYSGETKEMIDIANECQKNGCYVICITSSTSNTLASIADVSIAVSSRETLFRSGAMASRITQLYIVDILYALVSQLDYDRAIEKVNKTRITN
ncbi:MULTISPECIES: MurR/RpiR family transcriptional regulator [unclassified Breznakia]|uniref:MurR/RpiR family transcriptional regulator n=1 Tax=unclassified Breznakia TaxID=2623764 RepID=UPI0024761DCB|nr:MULTISPECIES: MurR/RpiR family transcriptional regulator [unclassified Breznakia]MDH6365929.1 DNA-binding MurR/RpiR family transcriptional regulator [Breznakia sp. PH1-1]MDH6403139.1 DNA-binding MurR/RpiR family transcriptional regulator [Breznakia sp. PF1-11]MDH6410848.1 DNA-binding MurR/RpiR family transcriptional regulator [Breznakia sp. PFB1-11]MDH6413095.1 DNA-binding MurR/RpiR family transcriptional regulator [Breznakia sp. PFB1-14]MDH6415463.1 DNA-binding MurR/RpiR family transcripti